MQPFETVLVDTLVVACDGTDAGGHPRVFLNLKSDGKIECPYCSRTFVLKNPGQASAPAHP